MSKERQKARAAARAKQTAKASGGNGPSQSPPPSTSTLSQHQQAELERWKASVWAGVTGEGQLIVVRKSPADQLDDSFFTALGMAAFSSMEARAVGTPKVKEGNGMRPQGLKTARRILGNLEESIEARRGDAPDLCEYVLEILNVDK